VGELIGVDQSTACRTITTVTDALVLRVRGWIRMPTQAEASRQKQRFYAMRATPGVIGCIDGTHIRMQGPNQQDHEFVNRKNYHSINVQVRQFCFRIQSAYIFFFLSFFFFSPLKIINCLFGDISPNMFILFLTIINCILPSRLLVIFLWWCSPLAWVPFVPYMFSHITITFKNYGFCNIICTFWHVYKPSELTHFFFFCFCVHFSLYSIIALSAAFHSINSHDSSLDSASSLCSSCLISAFWSRLGCVCINYLSRSLDVLSCAILTQMFRFLTMKYNVTLK